jgi:hypothetical protein
VGEDGGTPGKFITRNRSLSHRFKISLDEILKERRKRKRKKIQNGA